MVVIDVYVLYIDKGIVQLLMHNPVSRYEAKKKMSFLCMKSSATQQAMFINYYPKIVKTDVWIKNYIISMKSILSFFQVYRSQSYNKCLSRFLFWNSDDEILIV